MFANIMAYIPRHRKINPSTLIIPALFAFFLAYLLYHTLSGERGGLALIQMTSAVEKMQEELDNLRSERLNLEHRVKMLRNESVDKDLLDEKVRENLGLAAPDEEIYYLKTR